MAATILVLGRLNARKKGKYQQQADSSSVEGPAAFQSTPSKKKSTLKSTFLERISFNRKREPNDQYVTNDKLPVRVVAERDIGQQLGVLAKSLRGRLIICLVRAGSPAHKAGLEMGDEILQYGDTNTVSMFPDEFGKMLCNESARATSVMKTPITKRECPFLSYFSLTVAERGSHGITVKDGFLTSFRRNFNETCEERLNRGDALFAVNDENVMGMEDDQIVDVLDSVVGVVRLATMAGSDKKYLLKGLGVVAKRYQLQRTHTNPGVDRPADDADHVQRDLQLDMDGLFIASDGEE